MKVRLQVTEEKSAEAQRDWLLSEVNKGLVPGRRGLKLLFLVIAILVTMAAVVALLPELHSS